MQTWVLFCERERLDSTVCTVAMPGKWAIELAAQQARLEGFTVDEARDYARGSKPPVDNLKTVESVVEELPSIYKMWFAKWE